jgi:hypothetical protein
VLKERRFTLHTQRIIAARDARPFSGRAFFKGLALLSCEITDVFCRHCQRAKSVSRAVIVVNLLLAELVPALKSKMERRERRGG